MTQYSSKIGRTRSITRSSWYVSCHYLSLFHPTLFLKATLLAAVAGAFIVESQKSLSEDPVVSSALILSQIARQLNQSIVRPDTSLTTFLGPSSVERAVNALFYSSLGLSLANATLGLLCLQWIRGMKNEPPGLTSREYPSFRYARFQAFEVWGAHAIISSLPLLLIVALLAFFAGLLTLSSSKDTLATIPLYVIFPAIFAIILFTTFSPAVVVIRYSAFRKGSNFIPMPPFRSLQAWVAIQGLVPLFRAVSGVFKLNPFNAFASLIKCHNWGQLDHLWTTWFKTKPDDVLLFPLTLSTGTADTFNIAFKVVEEEITQLIGSPLKGDRKIEILRLILSDMEPRLPSVTMSHITDIFLGRLVEIINSGRSFTAIAPAFEFQQKLHLDLVSNGTFVLFSTGLLLNSPSGTILDTIRAFCLLAKRHKPGDKHFWNLFWRVLQDGMNGVDYMRSPDTLPLADALNAVKDVLESPMSKKETVLQTGFMSFVRMLAYQAKYDRSWVRSTHGSATMTAIVTHGVWSSIGEVIGGLSSAPDAAELRQCMKTLERVKEEVIELTSPNV